MTTFINSKSLRKVALTSSLRFIGETLIDFAMNVVLPDGWLSDDPPDLRCFLAMKIAYRGAVIRSYANHWMIAPVVEIDFMYEDEEDGVFYADLEDDDEDDE